MDASCQESTLNEDCGSIHNDVGCFYVAWVGVFVNASLINDHYIAPFLNHLHRPMNSNNNGLFKQDNALCDRLTRISMRSILETSNEWYGPIEHLWEKMEKSIRMQDPLHIQISAINGQLLRQDSSTSTLAFWWLHACHILLLAFSCLEDVLHDIRQQLHNIWHVYIVYSSLDKAWNRNTCWREIKVISFSQICNLLFPWSDISTTTRIPIPCLSWKV